MKTVMNQSLAALLFTVTASVALSACGGAPIKEVKVEEPQFTVTDAAPGGREAWLDNPNFWADKDGQNTKDFYYFTGDAQSADKRMACENAQANAIDDVGKQVSTFVNTSIARAASDSTGSDTNGMTASSASQTETSKMSSQLTETMVGGLEKKKQYWEQRNFSEKGGAKSIYYCWVLTDISKKKVDDLILRAESIRFKEDPQLKEKVENKMSGLQKEFEKYMQAH